MGNSSLWVVAANIRQFLASVSKTLGNPALVLSAVLHGVGLWSLAVLVPERIATSAAQGGQGLSVHLKAVPSTDPTGTAPRVSAPVAVSVPAPAPFPAPKSEPEPEQPRPAMVTARRPISPAQEVSLASREPAAAGLPETSVAAAPSVRDQGSIDLSALPSTAAGTQPPDSEAMPGTIHYEAGTNLTPWPDYPMLARRRGWEGWVLVGLRVAPDGSPRDVRVLESSGFPLLDRAALDTLARWQLPGRAAFDDVWIEVPVQFALR